MKQILTYFTKRYLPRWLVLLSDLLIVGFSFVLAFLLRFNFNIQVLKASFEYAQLLIVFPVVLFCFWKSKSYSGILRQSTTLDVMRIISSMFCAGIILSIVSVAGRNLQFPSFVVIPVSVVAIMVTVASTLLVFSRLLAKFLFRMLKNKNGESVKIMIFGAGQLGQITRDALLMDKSIPLDVVGFIDDNPSLQNKYTAGVPIYSADAAFRKIIPGKQVSELIFAIDPSRLTYKRKREITDLCLKQNITVKEVPMVNQWINGELNVKSIKRINIEDLLGRDAINLNCKEISKGLQNSVVLVTGAAGSIGSEIVRQLVAFNVKQVILVDKAESDLFHIINEIKSDMGASNFKAIVGDITNREKMEKIFSAYRPSIVFNAAAYKHVPLMEEFPCEAIRVNVGGTRLLANLSMNFGVEKFVFISTDKAVNPTNVMGASKRISEIYIQALSQSGEFSTKFITTRFGNVLGSNGSVVPLFRKQIEKGGPVTVTHKDITRYFMTIPEACQLVLDAGFMGRGGEIFVFDMGEPVKIYDLAEKMISLSGFIPHKNIKIEVTSLRPGEKLYEELLDNKEELLPTHNDKILIGKVRPHDFAIVSQKINNLLKDLDKKERCLLVNEMMEIVPEFEPANSLYKQRPIEKEIGYRK
jgi:FlaA1/EpsC-like NDP-sugar epimerase